MNVKPQEKQQTQILYILQFFLKDVSNMLKDSNSQLLKNFIFEKFFNFRSLCSLMLSLDENIKKKKNYSFKMMVL